VGVMPLQVSVDWKVKDSGPIYREAVQSTAEAIEQRSKQDVASNLKHAARFVRGTTAKVSKVSGGYSIKVMQRPGFAKVWETGGVSVGKPLLWIPAPGHRQKINKTRAKLFRPRGSRVLVAASGQHKGEVRFIGISSVTHRKRFHLKQIATEEAKRFAERWGKLFRS
jgi:hypothetical protein